LGCFSWDRRLCSSRGWGASITAQKLRTAARKTLVLCPKKLLNGSNPPVPEMKSPPSRCGFGGIEPDVRWRRHGRTYHNGRPQGRTRRNHRAHVDEGRRASVRRAAPFPRTLRSARFCVCADLGGLDRADFCSSAVNALARALSPMRGWAAIVHPAWRPAEKGAGAAASAA